MRTRVVACSMFTVSTALAAAGAAPSIRKRLEPRIRWTSETPTGACGRIWKKVKTAAVAIAERARSEPTPCSRSVAMAVLTADLAAAAAVA